MEKTIEQKRILLEKKLERLFLEEQFEESVESTFMSYEQWLIIRKLRQYQEWLTESKQKSKIESYYKIRTFRNKNITFSKYSTDEFIKNYLNTLESEFNELNRYDTFYLWKTYRNRFRTYEREMITFEGKKYHSESFKYVLDEREHVERKKGIKRKHVGKKDKNHGRKNPTNRR